TIATFVMLPILAFAIALWRVLGTSYVGLPIDAARLGMLVVFVSFGLLCERILVASLQFLARRKIGKHRYEFSPAIGRRAFVLSAIGVAVAGGGFALARRLYRVAT